MTTLFDLPPCDSPRLRWMKKHQVRTHHNEDVSPGDECELTGDTLYPWCAYTGEFNFPMPNAGFGDTELDAVTDWAIKNGVRLWNESDYPKSK